MFNVIVGIIAIILGLWGLFFHWILFKDVIIVLFFLGLIALGIVAFLAGVRKIRAGFKKTA